MTTFAELHAAALVARERILTEYRANPDLDFEALFETLKSEGMPLPSVRTAMWDLMDEYLIPTPRRH